MDLLSTIRKTGSRGGVNFSWDEVANSSRRENYLGHSLKAPVGRWQRGKDLNWYAKADATAADANETEEEREARERKEELRKVKEAEEDALARALGLPVKQRDTTGANSNSQRRTARDEPAKSHTAIAMEMDETEIPGADAGAGAEAMGATETRASDAATGVAAVTGRTEIADSEVARGNMGMERERGMRGGTGIGGTMDGTTKIEAAIVAGTAKDTDIGMTGSGAAAAPDLSRAGVPSVSEARAGDSAKTVNIMRRPVAIVFGGTRIGNRELFKPETSLESFLTILRVHNITTIDTAQAYGNSEATLGQVRAGEEFTLDTKWSPSSWTGTTPWATKDRIIETAEASVQKLGAAAGIFYLHQMDRLTPFPETLAAVNEVYRRGHFRRFGLSGFPPKDIEAVYNHCVERGYPLPSVYQGSYNPLGRDKETALLPTLRRLGMAFYAFGPSAGGFLGKTVAQAEQMKSNMDSVSATCKPYLRHPKYLEALARWNALAETEGLSAAEMAYRWMAHHSALEGEKGDALIIGTSSPEQLEESLAGIERGPLSDEACAGIQKIWESVAGAA